MHDVSIAVLAGGKSRRMGQNKSFVRVGGKPMIEHIIDQLSSLGLPMFIVTNDLETYAAYGLPLVRDVVADCGALGGIYSALRWCHTPYVLCAACDMPFLNSALLRMLIQHRPNYEAVVACFNDIWQVFPGVYSRACLPSFEGALSAGRFQLQGILDTLQICPLDVSEIYSHDPRLQSFINLNTPDELARCNAVTTE